MHNFYYVITQEGHSPLDLAHRKQSLYISENRKQKVIEILERQEKL